MVKLVHDLVALFGVGVFTARGMRPLASTAPLYQRTNIFTWDLEKYQFNVCNDAL